MDKIRMALHWIFRNRFWVTCVMVSLISVATWYMAWTAIEKQRDDSARKLKQKQSSIENVLNSEIDTGIGEESIRVHPNEATTQGMDQRIEAAGKGALAAWTERYNKQKDLLQYAGVLPQTIRDPLAAHEPMEKPLEKELLEGTQKDTFSEEIKKHMPDVAARAQTTWLFDDKGFRISDIEADERQKGKGGQKSGKGMNRGADLKVAEDLVVWDESNQELWNSKVNEFAGFNGNDDKDNRPTSQQMLALSQDLWILGGIFDAIADVNKGFTANDLAPVERIDHILVGQDAINDDLGSLVEYSFQVPISKGGSKASNKKGGLRTKRQRRRESNERRSAKKASRAASFDPTKSDSPFHGRYVDRDYSQLNVDEITKAITSDELTEQSYLAVAKRVPVRIAVKMDERRINDFLAAAANSPFAFEIRQVRINKHTPGEGVKRTSRASTSGNSKGGGGKLGLGGGGAGAGGNMADGGSSKGKRGGSAADDGPFQSERRSNFDIKIEFIGIVKIYNPVNPKLFFPEEANDGTGDNANNLP